METTTYIKILFTIYTLWFIAYMMLFTDLLIVEKIRSSEHEDAIIISFFSLPLIVLIIVIWCYIG
jgi:hypothetical protein